MEDYKTITNGLSRISKSIRDALKTSGVDAMNNRYTLHAYADERDVEILEYAQKIISKEIPSVSKEDGYPENLLARLGIYYTDINEDVEKGIDAALSTLTQREQDIILRRFRDGDTLESIAKDYGVTRERIRQTEAKSLRKLRRPASLYHIVYGEKGFSSYEKMKKALDVKTAEFQQTEQEYNAKIKELQEKQKQLSALEKTPNNELREKLKSGAFSTLARDISIKDAGLSIRSYNCLKRAGIHTIGDLSNFTSKDLKRIRNLGFKSYTEITEMMEFYGVKCKTDEEQAI